MKDIRFASLLALFVLLGAAIFIFYGPDPSSIPTFAALFLLPAAIGATITKLVDPRGTHSPMGCFVWPTAGLVGAALLAWLTIGEGAICIAMILPLWLPAAVAGALIQAWSRRQNENAENRQGRIQMLAWVSLPLAAIPLEQQYPQEWETRSVVREVTLNAAPAEVWPLLVTIPAIARNEGAWNVTQDLLGVPRPLDASLVQRGPERVRLARWDRGISFEERITRYKPGQQICWDFVFPNDSVQRETDRHISPDGPFLKIRSGCYTLNRTTDGETLLRLETTYTMRVRLGTYFVGWGELLLGDVQSNILQIVSDRTS